MGIAQPALLLVSSSPPGRHGVGQVYIRDMCRLLPPGSVGCFAILRRGEGWSASAAPGGMGLGMEVAIRRYEAAFSPVSGPLGRWTAWAAQQSRFVPYVGRLAAHAANWAEALRATAIWSVLACPTSIEMSERLARRLRLPLYSLVWDAPEVALRAFGHQGMSLRHLVRRFDAAIRRSTRVAVVSQLLQEDLRTRFGVETVLLRHALDPALVRRDLPRWRPESSFVIGFAGSVTAASELQTLQTALDAMNWRIGRRHAILRLFGCRYVLQAETERRIEYRGSLPDTPDVVAALAECDITYLPQPFDPGQRTLARHSFPTKLSTYLAAGRPVLVHSPPDSSTGEFCREHPVGAWCGAADAASLAAALVPLASDPQVYADAAAQAQTTCRDQFHEDVARRQLFHFLGLDIAP